MGYDFLIQLASKIDRLYTANIWTSFVPRNLHNNDGKSNQRHALKINTKLAWPLATKITEGLTFTYIYIHFHECVKNVDLLTFVRYLFMRR